MNDLEKLKAKIREYAEISSVLAPIGDADNYLSGFNDALSLFDEVLEILIFYSIKKNVNRMCNGTGDDFYEEEGVFNGGKRARQALANLEKKVSEEK